MFLKYNIIRINRLLCQFKSVYKRTDTEDFMNNILYMPSSSLTKALDAQFNNYRDGTSGSPKKTTNVYVRLYYKLFRVYLYGK